jgi:hypothetical protein
MTPILAAIHLDTLIWVVLLLIGAIGSIASNVRKVRQRAPEIRQRVLERHAVTVAPTAPTRPPVTTMVPRPRAVAAQPPAPPVPEVPRTVPHGTRGFRGMFERGNLVGAIVAAEVLGPPKALQEQSIWSPRHSEPSI